MAWQSHVQQTHTSRDSMHNPVSLWQTIHSPRHSIHKGSGYHLLPMMYLYFCSLLWSSHYNYTQWCLILHLLMIPFCHLCFCPFSLNPCFFYCHNHIQYLAPSLEALETLHSAARFDIQYYSYPYGCSCSDLHPSSIPQSLTSCPQ